MAGRPPLYNSAEELQQKIDAYFGSLTAVIKDGQIERAEQPATITGLALFLGFSDRQSLYDYEEREEFSCIIKRARLRVECEYEKKLSYQSPTGSIFALKNMGWKDKTEQEVNGNLGITWVENKTYLNGSNGKTDTSD